MGSTARSLVIALRTDATGVSEGFAQAQKDAIKFTEGIKAAQSNLSAARNAPVPSEWENFADSWRKQHVQMAEDELKFQKFLRDEAVTTATLERDQVRQRMMLLDAGVQKQIQGDRAARDAAMESQRQMMAGLQEQDAKMQLIERRRERIEDLASVGMRQNFGQGWNPSDETAGGASNPAHMQGWMMRMAGMDIARNAADVIAPGSGGALGMAGYFAAGGGAMMAGLGGAMAGLGIAAVVANKVHEETVQLQKDQRAYNDELDASARKWDEIGQSQIRTTGPGSAARNRANESFSQMQALREKAIGIRQGVIDPNSITGVGNFADWASWAWQSRGIGDDDQIAGRSTSFGFMGSQSGSDNSTWAQQQDMAQRQMDLASGSQKADEQMMAAQQRLAMQRMAQDNAIATARDQQNAEMATRGVGIAGMPGGRSRQRAEDQFAFDQADLRRRQDTAAKAIKIQRDYQDSENTLASERTQAQLTADTMRTGGGAFLQSQNKTIDAQQAGLDQQRGFDEQRIAQENEAAKAMNQIDADRAAAKLALDQEIFNREQANEAAQAYIAGERDPYQRQIDQQKELNNEKWEGMQLAGDTDAQLQKQSQIGDQILANLQREIDYERGLLDIETKRADVEHRMAQAEINRINQQTGFMSKDSQLEQQQKLLDSLGMTRSAQYLGIPREQNEAAQADADAKLADQRWRAEQQQANLAYGAYQMDRNVGTPQQAEAARIAAQKAQDEADKAHAQANQADERAREADRKWMTDKQALDNEHARAVQNEIQNIQDATAVAQGRMTHLQADRRAFERNHPDERSKAELDALDRAKQGQVNADFERQMREKEIDLAEKEHMISPYEADLAKLKMEHPDVKDSDLKKMAMLDQMGQHGDMSTRYTMGQTNFAMLGAHWSRGGVAGSVAGGMIQSGNPMISGANPFIHSSLPSSPNWGRAMAAQGSNTNATADTTNAILKRIESVLNRLEHSMN